MEPGDLDIDLAGEQVILLPERALYWPRMATLFVADAHWGKAASFRANAVAIPSGTTEADLARLSGALDRTGAQRLVLLGDLLHAQKGRVPGTLATIGAWRERYTQLEVLLVRGNHDQWAGDPPDEWKFTCVDAPASLPPFVLQHEPGASAEGYALAGHVHPGARLVGAGRQELKLPCFWFRRRVGVLPAFGSFTGLATIRPRRGDHVFVITGDEVIAVA